MGSDHKIWFTCKGDCKGIGWFITILVEMIMKTCSYLFFLLVTHHEYPGMIDPSKISLS